MKVHVPVKRIGDLKDLRRTHIIDNVYFNFKKKMVPITAKKLKMSTPPSRSPLHL